MWPRISSRPDNDCPAFWELASTDRSDLPWEGPPLFERAMRELGRESLSVEDAAVVAARGAAAECLAGQITPRAFTARVYELACAADYPVQLMELFGLHDEYGGWGRNQADLDRATLDAARTLLEPN